MKFLMAVLSLSMFASSAFAVDLVNCKSKKGTEKKEYYEFKSVLFQGSIGDLKVPGEADVRPLTGDVAPAMVGIPEATDRLSMIFTDNDHNHGYLVKVFTPKSPKVKTARAVVEVKNYRARPQQVAELECTLIKAGRPVHPF